VSVAGPATPERWQAFDLGALRRDRRPGDRPYAEFLRVPAMSAGVYHLPAGGTDPQRPHREDELYYVIAGRATIRVGGEDCPVAAGSAVYVPAGVPHRFHSIAEALDVLVLFAPEESEG
jgi:mannose-6-phosphate isomerase-like protein (cupin superfamily)